MAKQQDLRQRKTGNNKKNKSNDGAAVSKNAKAVAPKSTTIEVGLPKEETLLDIFFSHPLVRVAPFVLLPYIIYNLYYYVTLRHPEIISMATLGLIALRPAFQADDVRQVLILGPEMAENKYVTVGMASPLRLEIVLEGFDAQNYYCRDGTVSWFQLMRFLEPLTADSKNKEARFGAWKELCIDRNHTFIEMFHPKEYAPSECDSYYALHKWSDCWSKECLSLVKSLWACENDEVKACPQQFSRILHQVRHPMRSIETLKAGICPHPELQNSFLNVVAGFFPDRDWSSMPCLNAMAWYLVDFHHLLMKAREAGLVHGLFQIENTSPCEVAKMAGFVDEETALYAPNSKKTTRACRDDDVNVYAQSKDTFTKAKTENKGDAVLGLAPVVLKDFGDPNLATAVKDLIQKLGYAQEGDSEFLG